MKRLRLPALSGVLAIVLAVLGTGSAGASPPAAASTGCQLSPANSAIKHVVYLQFDNTHYARDNSSVASDLEQMPHLLNFITQNGTLLTNDHTILISHTAGGILSTQTGLYPDRHGITVSNSYGYFPPPPSTTPAFSSAFKYWTDLVDDSTGVRDPLPNMITDGQKNTPAPWVPFTRAGCDFGSISLANIELENTGTGPFGDMSEAFGTGSPEWTEAATSNAAPSGTPLAARALTDFVGIAVHCALRVGSICAANATNVANSRPDRLPDEPGGYLGYQALYGAKYVDPAIAGGPCVNNTEGQHVTDPYGQCGFPGFDGAFAKNTLGYLASMQEAGIPVTWGYISDAHDNHTAAFPAPFNPGFPRASGPGEADYRAQLKAYDDAFAAFFQRLNDDGINQSNTLFMFTVDEGDHFVGGIGAPQPDGSLAYSHTNCSWTTTPACPSNQIGEVNLNLRTKLGNSTFSVHSDDAPTFYVNGNPGRTDPTLRALERRVAGMTAVDPYLSPDPTAVIEQMADRVEQQTLHMQNSDPARSPSFTAFGNPDFFMTATGTGTAIPSCGSNPCIDYHFAWNHGDIQPEIATTWVGWVGPGVLNNGIDTTTWSDHTNVRPTMLALLGLKDDYRHDGRVITEVMDKHAIPQTLFEHRNTTSDLANVYEQLNAPFGQFGLDTLTASTRGIVSTDDSVYGSTETSIQNLTAQRDALALKISSALDGAAFDGQMIKESDAKSWIAQAQSLIDEAAALAAGS
ncbi:MAG TPA: hypothetical protein VFL27_10740 [Candidatus Dormibacteraeota bacterium]|nr:hypothetical protein [Candidatus Dormibacteraeota bacterium]